jgi:ribosomal protein L32
MDSSYVMCFAAKWKDTDELFYDSVKKSGAKRMLKRIHKLLDEADVVVHFNGSRFDIPVLNKEFLLYGLYPPATYKQVDLLRVARAKFKFPSNKLDYLAKVLGFGGKYKHAGHELWVRCLAGDLDAWAEMEKYNKHDVVLLEAVYHRLLPWIPNHPNYALYSPQGAEVCPNCGSEHLTKRGFSYSAASKYQRYQCKGCGAWSRSKNAEKGIEHLSHV